MRDAIAPLANLQPATGRGPPPRHGLDVRENLKTTIRPDGLRYASKAAGATEFPGSPGSTISCLLCGRHMGRSHLSSFLLAGRRQYRCRGGC